MLPINTTILQLGLYQLQFEGFIVDSILFSISSERPLKKSILVSDSILSILVTKDFKLDELF
jgi:hypothetical protein